MIKELRGSKVQREVKALKASRERKASEEKKAPMEEFRRSYSPKVSTETEKYISNVIENAIVELTDQYEYEYL